MDQMAYTDLKVDLEVMDKVDLEVVMINSEVMGMADMDHREDKALEVMVDSQVEMVEFQETKDHHHLLRLGVKS